MAQPDGDRLPLLGGAGLPSNDPELQERRERGETLSWRERVAIILEAHITHQIIILLIGIDASCVLADLVYSFLHSECPATKPLSNVAFAAPGLKIVIATVLVEEGPEWLTVLSYISLAITTLFLVEIPLALWAFGPKYYTPRVGGPYAGLHLFDACVVITTFVLEVVLRGQERELAGLLILLRLWRLVKLVGGLAVGAGEMNERLSEQLAEADEELDRKNQYIASLEAENRELRRRTVGLEGANS